MTYHDTYAICNPYLILSYSDSGIPWNHSMLDYLLILLITIQYYFYLLNITLGLSTIYSLHACQYSFTINFVVSKKQKTTPTPPNPPHLVLSTSSQHNNCGHHSCCH